MFSRQDYVMTLEFANQLYSLPTGASKEVEIESIRKKLARAADTG